MASPLPPLQQNRPRKKNVKPVAAAKAAKVVKAATVSEAVDAMATDVVSVPVSAKVNVMKVRRPKPANPAPRAKAVAMNVLRTATTIVKATVLNGPHANDVMPWPHKVTAHKLLQWTLQTTP